MFVKGLPYQAFASAAALGFVLGGCVQQVEEPNTTPPPEGNVIVEPPDTTTVQPPGGDGDGDTTITPTPEPQPTADACPYNGNEVDCNALLGTAETFCANAYANPQAPNYGLISACGSCDATFFSPPIGSGALCLGDATYDEQPIDPETGNPYIDLPESTCKSCHAPNGYDGQHSIEDPHPWASVDCVGCHGGDGTATNPTYAHVCAPAAIGNRQQQVLDPRAFFLSFTTAGVQFLPDYTCTTQAGEQKPTTALDYLAFINPGDLRPGQEGKGCGSCHGASAEDPATGEHLRRGGDVVSKVARSVMGQATGINSGSRHGIGAPNAFADRRGNIGTLDWNTQADYGATTVVNPTYNPNDPNRVVGEVGSLKSAPVRTGAEFKLNQTYTADAVNNSLNLTQTNADNYPNGINNAIAEDLFQEVLNQACTGCHLQNNYNNNRAGDYRSNGCSTCHFETGVLGRSGSDDPNVNKYEPIDPNNLTPGEIVHIRDHRVRNIAKFPGQIEGLYTVVQGISDTNCLVCHEGSNRTVAQYHGYRLDQNQDLVNNNFYPSQNTVQFELNTDLFGENQNFNGRNLNQWIKNEIWQADVTNILAQAGQDQTPEDVHHEAGMGCVDCHGTGATHGRGEIYSRMKVATHQNDTLCETCHGTVDGYAENDGRHILDQGGYALDHTYTDDPASGEYWLVSKLNGSTHYIPQVKDIVDATQANGFGKQYPPGAARAGQPIFNWVASYAMGRFQNSQDLSDGMGPEQPNNTALAQYMRDGFSHSDGAFGYNSPNQGMECYTCHASWQNNCIGCHLDAFYDDNPNNYFFSQVTGERIYFNFNANFVYQNPVNFMLGTNDRGKISVYQGLHRFFSYTDLNNNTSNRVAYGDRNGLGNDPQLRLATRNNLPALENQPFTPHSIRGRYNQGQIGGRGCLDCHWSNANATIMHEQTSDPNNNFYPFQWDLTNIIANQENYANAIPFNVNQAYGLGTNLWLFDADGNAVVDTNNAPVYDLDRIVEAQTGVTNTSSNHPLLDPNGMNPEYVQFQDTNAARVARPLAAATLNRLDYINTQLGGLGDVYYYNAAPAQDPNNTGYYVYFLNDFNYVGQ